MNETPTISNYTRESTTYGGGMMDKPIHRIDSSVASGWVMPEDIARRGPAFKQANWLDKPPISATDIEKMFKGAAAAVPDPRVAQPPVKKEIMARIVKVYIADPDTALELNKRVLHSGEEQLTDLSDQELYFDIAVGDLLKEHNALRSQTLDKKATAKAGKDVYLEPIRIRDLKMVVVTIAEF
jgi:hypothetical protein